MWSDNDIDDAFQRLNPPEPAPASFPLDAWLRLETQLDKATIERAVQRKLWRYFAAEVAAVALMALGWLLWLSGPAQPAGTVAATATATAKSTAAASATSENTAGPGTGGELATAQANAETTTSVSIPAALAATTTPDQPPLVRQLPGLPPGQPRPNPLATDRRPAQIRWVAGAATARALAASSRAKPEKANYPRHEAAIFEKYLADTTPFAKTSRDKLGLGAAKRAATDFAAGSRARYQAASPMAGRLNTTEAPAAASETRKQPGTEALETPTRRPAGDIAKRAEEPLALRAVRLPAAAPPALPGPLATVAVAATLPTATLPTRQPRFFVGLVAAPDVSTVKFADLQSPLPNVGLTLEYRLTDRLRLSTGLLRSTKHYTAHREDYDWGAYTARIYQRDFRDVAGSCTVLDVPLNLRYDALVRPQARVFGSAGLSSYFMQRERYSYAWVDTNGPGLWTREAVNENHHLFSILNLSAGYERSLGARWSLQAEPYLKLPLSGVGAGKVRLVSAGVFVGVKYGF